MDTLVCNLDTKGEGKMEAIRNEQTGSWHVYEDNTAIGRVDPVFDGAGPNGYLVMIFGPEYDVRHPDIFADLGAAFTMLWRGHIKYLATVAVQPF